MVVCNVDGFKNLRGVATRGSGFREFFERLRLEEFRDLLDSEGRVRGGGDIGEGHLFGNYHVVLDVVLGGLVGRGLGLELGR